ncbi:hypothetical protein MTR_1g112410 [Medicago truncatula]|uniref:Uncharacterized protein n=1 Tax=Medicago truncatula TaxID=3880 RepID=A0A072W262_MEDTR|nr:hypothetical protein MTR_1g112410 [Medicago truncatula]
MGVYIWIHHLLFDKILAMPKNVKLHFGRSGLYTMCKPSLEKGVAVWELGFA